MATAARAPLYCRLRLSVAAVAGVLVLGLTVGGGRAGAETVLGSADPGAAPDTFVCALCGPGINIGFRQFALRGATLEAPETGVLVSARAYARRLAGTEEPRIVVLRPADGVGATVVDSAPLPVSSPGGALQEASELHLPVQFGDVLGFVFRTGQVDLGVRRLPRPDGALVFFGWPCGPCGADLGTGIEPLFNGTIEPDFDEDLLGDESQDPDGGGLFADEELDEPWLEEEDPYWLEEDEELEPGGEPAAQTRLRLVRVLPGRHGGAALLVAVPRAGRLTATATTSARRTAKAAGRLTVATGKARSSRARRVSLQLRPSRAGQRLLARRARVRARLTVTFQAKGQWAQVLTRALTLRPTRRR